MIGPPMRIMKLIIMLQVGIRGLLGPAGVLLNTSITSGPEAPGPC